MPTRGADQDAFLGALLGMAIGDAMGMPVQGWSAERIKQRFGRIAEYHRRVFADGAEIKAGEFTDESEIALCIVESLTVNQGTIDPDNIGARLLFLAKGESRRWMGADTLAALARADTTLNFHMPLDEDGPATGDVALRGVPIGLLHAVGAFDAAKLRSDAELVTRLTHGSPAAITAVTAVALVVSLAARGEVARARWAADTASFLGGGALAEALGAADDLMPRRVPIPDAITTLGSGQSAAEAVASGIYTAMAAERFEDAVFAAVNGGGASDTRGAVAGSLLGAADGASGIPQGLIDDLESRIYVSLAAPWFYRTALRRAGLVIDLRPEN